MIKCPNCDHEFTVSYCDECDADVPAGEIEEVDGAMRCKECASRWKEDEAAKNAKRQAHVPKYKMTPTTHGKDRTFPDGYVCEAATCPGSGAYYIDDVSPDRPIKGEYAAILCRKHAIKAVKSGRLPKI